MASSSSGPDDRDVGGVHPDERQPQEAARDQERADGHGPAGPDLADEARDDVGGAADPDGHGEEGEPGLERAVAQDVLDELGDEEEGGEHGRGQTQHDDVGAGPVAIREDVQRHQGVGALGSRWSRT